MRISRSACLAAVALLILLASAPSFAESYRGLYEWAAHHGLHGTWAVIWPLQIDVFIAVGELVLFVGLADQWQRRGRIGAWMVTGLGLAVSIAGNVGHVGSGDWTWRLTAAVPPTAAFAALAVGLGVVKRVAAGSAAPKPSTAAVVKPGRSAVAKAATGAAAVPVAAAGPILVGVTAAATGAAPVAITAGHRRQAKRKPKRQLTTLSKADQDATISALLQSEPELSRGELARRTGLSQRTVGRALQRISDPVAHGLT